MSTASVGGETSATFAQTLQVFRIIFRMARPLCQLLCLLILVSCFVMDGFVSGVSRRAGRNSRRSKDYGVYRAVVDDLHPLELRPESTESRENDTLRDLESEDADMPGHEFNACLFIERVYQMFCADVKLRLSKLCAGIVYILDITKACTPVCGTTSEKNNTCVPCRKCDDENVVEALCAPEQVCCSNVH